MVVAEEGQAVGETEKRPFLSHDQLQQRLLRIGGRLIKHARYYVAVAERHLTSRLFGGVHRRIATFPSTVE